MPCPTDVRAGPTSLFIFPVSFFIFLVSQTLPRETKIFRITSTSAKISCHSMCQHVNEQCLNSAPLYREVVLCVSTNRSCMGLSRYAPMERAPNAQVPGATNHTHSARFPRMMVTLRACAEQGEPVSQCPGNTNGALVSQSYHAEEFKD